MPPFLHRAFGGLLRCDLPLPELPLAGASENGARDRRGRFDAPSSGTARGEWRVALPGGDPPPAEGLLLGEEEVRDGSRVRLFLNRGGYQLHYDDTGVWRVSNGGARVDWHPPKGPHADPERFAEAARIDLLGRVMGTALHAGGDLVLHGSAVEVGGRGAAFLAPKFHGKSTLAAALVEAGARLITDDTLPVAVDADPVLARPGVPALRLWPDSAGRASWGGYRMGHFGKLQRRELPPESRCEEPVPLGSIHLLVPVESKPGRPVIEEIPLAGRVAALQLVAQARVGPLLGGSEAGRLLERAARVAERVPVGVLRVERGYERLPAVVEALMVRLAGGGTPPGVRPP